MKLCIVIGNMNDQTPEKVVPHLALEAHNRGHKVLLVPLDSLTYDDEEDKIFADGLYIPNDKKFDNTANFMNTIKEQRKYECISDYDIILFRANPAEGVYLKNAKNLILDFGRKLKNSKTIVLNEPEGLIKANSKLYLTSFPKHIRPKTLVTRDYTKIREFLQNLDKPAIVKPLDGSGGKDVYYIEKGAITNLKQIVETITAYTYMVVQEYIPEAKQGDKRILLLNGNPIHHKGVHAVYMRKTPADDIRSNIHVGGTPIKAELTEEEKKICQYLKPKLVHDGLYFVGVDLIGNKVLEINVYAPGGIHNIKQLTGVNFSEFIITDLERKVRLKKAYRSTIDPKLFLEA